jgi:hypothetical protein
VGNYSGSDHRSDVPNAHKLSGKDFGKCFDFCFSAVSFESVSMAKGMRRSASITAAGRFTSHMRWLVSSADGSMRGSNGINQIRTAARAAKPLSIHEVCDGLSRGTRSFPVCSWSDAE